VETGREYEVQRALILLKDLERMIQGNAPAVKLHPANAEVPCLHGDATHAGLLRLAVELARAAIIADHSEPIRVTEDGQVCRQLPASPSVPAEVIRLELVDDRPAATGTTPHAGCLDSVFSVFWLVILGTLGFAVVGLLHTANWLRTLALGS
jgi:hypothetical protein